MNSRGFGLLEVVLSLMVGSILMAALIYALHHSIASHARVADLQREYYTELRLKSILQSLISNYDAHPLEISPRVHQHGKITYTDESINPVAFGAHPPNPNSSAITGMELSFIESLQVVPKEIGASPMSFRGCKSYGRTFRPLEYQGYIGITLDGLYELNGTVSAESTNCYRLTLGSSKSMSITSIDPAFLGNVRMLVPIVAHYTIYQAAQSGEIRYLSHKGAVNIENQPLTGAMPTLTISMQLAWHNRVLFLESELKLDKISMILPTLHSQHMHTNQRLNILNWH